MGTCSGCSDISDSWASAGKGCIYSFDPVGSYEREEYRAGGSASAMLQPLLDNQVYMLRDTECH